MSSADASTHVPAVGSTLSGSVEHPDAPPDVLVVGSGLFGLSTALHLARAGRRVLVVDEGTPASGTTAAGAGFVGLWAAGYAWYWNESERDLEQYGIDFYRELARTADIGYRDRGNAWLSVTDAGYRDHILPFDRHPLKPEGARLLTPDEAAEVIPGLSAAAVTGGFLHPAGIQISAPDAALALAAEVVRAGVRVQSCTAVTSVLVEDGRATGVRTAAGEELRAGQVVLASGSWTNALLAPLGRQLPFARVLASRLTTQPFGLGEIPTLMLPELQGLWVREHRGGLTYGHGGGYEALGSRDVPAERRPQRTDLIDAMRADLAPRLAALIPAGGDYADTAEWTQGIVSMTADRRFIVGPVPEAAGLWVVAGDNESGVTHGPGLGRLAAELVTGAAPSAGDPELYRPDRFDGVDYDVTDEAAVAAAMPARREVDALRGA
ncbi:FAD-binding oxidoreductase [Schumannella sp. 10F1B-5-1]|uniref:NAD(P)/FAD-dependent oxidoreductase n=1 Tax=Schumannella sp. 10F1B-5-1 TaxID=2590780 RepID=UPI001130FCD8|nr:FAD-binding oxidoreductase [Schumannella sp. 10F1B-5-1]TPW72312.1 FAD-binding oxidoreductase [Schumannella sp. 10F1B-5-1]